MECGCTTIPENIYFRCRKDAAMCNQRLNSREGAAELLDLSPSQLANYELGTTKTIPPDAVVLMAELYNAPELKAHYCSHCPIGQDMPIATNIYNLEMVTVRMLKVFWPDELDSVKKNYSKFRARSRLRKAKYHRSNGFFVVSTIWRKP